MAPRQGKSLERLVLYLERLLSASGNVTVESPKRLKDKRTGELREHDVVVTISANHHTVLLALECRDRAKPVGVPQVEALHTKCSDTGIDQAAIVSASGFCTTARTKAASLGIRCLSLDHALSIPWVVESTFVTTHRRIDHVDFQVSLADESSPLPQRFTMVTQDGSPTTDEILMHNVREGMKSLKYSAADRSPAMVTLRFGNPDLLLLDQETGGYFKVKQVTARVTFSIVHQEVPFQFFQYLEGDCEISNAAVGSFEVGDHSASVMVARAPDGKKKFLFVPERLVPRRTSS